MQTTPLATGRPRMLQTLAFLFLFLCYAAPSRAQIYATTRTSSGLIAYDVVAGLLTSPSPTTSASYGSVIDTSFITDGIYTNAATLTAKCFSVIVGFAGEAWVEPKFSSPLPSGSTAYFRIDLPTSSGLSVDILSTVGALTNLFANNIIITSAYSGATTTDTGVRVSNAKVKTALVKDTAGNYYLAVTADTVFNAARIGLRFNTSLLGVSFGSSLSMKVYYGVQYTDADCNGRPAYTDLGISSGLTVLALDSVVNNPVNAMDNNLSSFSRLGGSGLLSVGVASSMAQTFYFKTFTTSTDRIRLTLSTPGTLLDLGLANSIKIAAYKQDTFISEQLLGSLLTLDLLTLLSSSSGYPVYINPGGAFDRVKVTYSHLVGADLIGNGINIYDVRAVPDKPILSKDTLTIYQYTIPVISATTLSGNEVKWFNKMHAELGTGGSFPPMDTISTTAPYYARASRIPCANLSDTAKFYVKVVPLTYTNPLVGTQSVAYSSLALTLAGSGISGAGFRYTLASGSSLPAGLTLNSNGTITGMPSVTDTLTFDALLRDTVNDMDAGRHSFLLIIRAPLALAPMTLPIGTSLVAYTTTLPPATGGTGNYTYSLAPTPPLPSGMSFNLLTRVLSGTAVTGIYPFQVNATDDEGRSTFRTFSFEMGSILPIYLVSFKGKLQNKVAQLSWQTANEVGIKYMTLMRSKDGVEWTSRIRLTPPEKGNGTYTFADTFKTVSGEMMYKLIITDQSSQEHYSDVAYLKNSEIQDQELLLFPNPAKVGSVLYFEYTDMNPDKKNIQLLDKNGMIKYSIESTDNFIKIPDVATGTYILHILLDNGEVMAQKIIVQ